MNPVIMPPMMDDQATDLRKLVSSIRSVDAAARISGVKSVAILSGKGGVGKSSLAVNLSLAMAELGLRVTILDADLGLANLDILFGVTPKFHMGHVMRGDKELADIIYRVGDMISIIPGGAGLRDLADIDDQKQAWIINRLSNLEAETDILILDTSAGIHKNVLSFAMASDLSLLITTPEPTAIRDSYSVLKSLFQMAGSALNAGMVVNMVKNEREGISVGERIIATAGHFLNVKIPYFGCVIWDAAMMDAVRRRRPLLMSEENSVSAPCFRELARKILEFKETPERSDGITAGNSFIGRLARQIAKKES
ncbi:MAG: MinD/ParA family protein [Synergistaceae bacterium]|jgi:flagellar biosynthesis protein FlhG|nr:MinD/ParA family protein [Synergistaceae bacterium]